MKDFTYKSLSDVDIDNIVSEFGEYTASPTNWEDQVLYFLMLDRFSNNTEKQYRQNDGTRSKGGTTLPFHEKDNGNAIKTQQDSQRWSAAGNIWCGGNLKGLKSKVGYLKRLGVTAIWISPLFKQVDVFNTYHGYGIQNFLEIDPRFGTKSDLREFVDAAHQQGIYVIMDIIYNHSGDVFGYSDEQHHYQEGRVYDIDYFRDEKGQLSIPTNKKVPHKHFPQAAIWPDELQSLDAFSRKGLITKWDAFPETLEGDFPHPKGLYELRDFDLGGHDIEHYRINSTIRTLSRIYKYWIAIADIDGYRIDTVKHMSRGATRYFCSVIHEFAQSIGKENFYLIGEVTGGRQFAFETMEKTGLDAVLGINDVPGKMDGVIKGEVKPAEYFDLFRDSLSQGKDSHTWFRNKVVTMFDDHDQVRKGTSKARFGATLNGPTLYPALMAVNLLSSGIPCIYYGSEQAFDGAGGDDRYIRECMFGGPFGAFRSKDRHFFNESFYLYQVIAQLIEVRKNHLELRRGRQYLRPISGNGEHFGYPGSMGGKVASIIAWSRIFNDREVLVAINNDPIHKKGCWVTIDEELSTGQMNVLFTTEAAMPQKIPVDNRNGKSVFLELSPGGVVILE